MKRTRTLLVAGIAAVLVAIAFLLALPPKAPPEAVRQAATAAARLVPSPPPAQPPPVADSSDVPEQSGLRAEPSPTQLQSTNAPPRKAKPGQPVNQDPPTTDDLARTALAFVGFDADAEEYWAGAINDPSLPSGERRNLIEDLNEDGFSDPRHPTMDDLPLIISRLGIIEQMGPDAMDQVNAEAFAEADKDLRKMYQDLTGESWPP
jgi:hypothetical protein